MQCRVADAAENAPHPDALPEYQERGLDEQPCGQLCGFSDRAKLEPEEGRRQQEGVLFEKAPSAVPGDILSKEQDQHVGGDDGHRG